MTTQSSKIHRPKGITEWWLPRAGEREMGVGGCFMGASVLHNERVLEMGIQPRQ